MRKALEKTLTSPFAAPGAGGDQFDPKEHHGRLLLIYPKAYNPAEPTKFGESPAADADVVVVDAPNGAVTLKDARLFGNLAKSVRNQVGTGQPVLGRLGQGENTKGNPPWIILDATQNSQDVALAGPAHAAYQAGEFTPPQPAAAAPPPPADDPWAVGGAPAVTPTAAPAGPDLRGFLKSKGLQNVDGMPDDTVKMIASSYPDAPR